MDSTRPDLSTEELRLLDRQHIWHPFTPMKLWNASDPLVIVAAEGMHLIDSDGNRYLDGVSSLWCNVHGHCVPEIDQAIIEQLGKVAHSTMLGLASEPAILLADRLMKLVPPGLSKVFYSDAGATATEIAFKLAAQYWFNIGRPEKNEFVGFAEAYHGDTVGAMSIGRMPAFHRPYFPMLFKTHFAPTPYVYRHRFLTPSPSTGIAANGNGGAVSPLSRYSGRGLGRGSSADPSSTEPSRQPSPGVPGEGPNAVAADCLESLEFILHQHSSRIAAICIEPVVQGAGGMIIQPAGFLKSVRELAKRYDVLLICDEVATGFGRTGKMFACEHEGISPDLMCVAKGITGGYLPLAATFATDKIYNAFLADPWEGKTFYHGHTYTGNPLACAAALASLDLFEKHDLVRQVEDKSHQLAALLEGLRALPHVGDLRQKGFMVGIELVADRDTKQPFDSKRRIGAEVCLNLRKHGVILRPLGDVIVMMPPLAMGMADLETIVKALNLEIARLQI